jgi:hypothetical protein
MLIFNGAGYLTPNRPIRAGLEEMEQEFVINYSSVDRSMLYESYCRYSDDLKKLCSDGELRQWINGSFTTRNTLRPNDIDLVTFIDAELVIQLGEKITPFIFPNSKLNYPGIDGYIVSVYPSDHPSYFSFQSDEAYWLDEFDTTRRNRRTGRKAPKGFLEIYY